MMMMLYVAWYFMSELNLRRRKIEVAYGIANNALIGIERNQSASEYILMLFKYNMFKVLMSKGRVEQAEICLNQAKYVATKYAVEFEFDENVETGAGANEEITEEAGDTAAEQPTPQEEPPAAEVAAEAATEEAPSEET
jgi:hypothetical protein